MGSYATEHVPKMTLEQMQEYERILSCETVDIFNYLSGQTPVPDVRSLMPRLLGARCLNGRSRACRS